MFVIERKEPEGLVSHRWTFLLMDVDGIPTLVLDGWARYSRPTRRHGWMVCPRTAETGRGSQSYYHRGEEHRRYYDGVEEQDAPLPDDVAAEALNAARETIRVVRWSERRNKPAKPAGGNGA